jgi:hypothetical protein
MNEREPNQEDMIYSQEAIKAVGAHKLVLEEAFEELADTEPLLYHNPAHTYGELLDGTKGGVLGVTRQLLNVVDMHLTEAYITNQPSADIVLARQLGTEAGAAFHDTVMQIRGLTEVDNPILRKVIRQGGWKEEGNEYESYRLLRNFTEDYMDDGPFKDEYLEAAEAAIQATLPQATFASVPTEAVEEYSERVQDLLRGEDGVYRGLLIAPAEAPETLSGLLLTTADLSAVRSPEIFYRTGNAEFWELHYGLAAFAVTVLDGETPIKRDDARILLQEMKAWRRTQVGFALQQRVRLGEQYTPQHIQSLLYSEYLVSIGEAEARSIVEGITRRLATGMDDSIEDSAARYEAFSNTYTLSEAGAADLSETEVTRLQHAIKELGGEHDRLTAYTAWVERDLG